MPGSLSSALQAMYFGFGDFLSTNCHFMPVGKPAPPRPRSPDAFTISITWSGVMRQRLLQPFVALVLQVEVEREAVRLADVCGEERFHVTARHAFSIDVMTAGERRLAAARAGRRAAAGTSLGLQALVPRVVDHHDRRAVAGAETLDLDAA